MNHYEMASTLALSVIGNDFEHNLCTQLAACRHFPVVIVLNQPIALQGEKPAW